MKFIPSNKPDDNLFNRRILAYVSFFFSIIWVVLVYITDVLMIYNLPLDRIEHRFDMARIAAYLGVPGMLCGLSVWAYFDGARKEQNSLNLGDKHD